MSNGTKESNVLTALDIAKKSEGNESDVQTPFALQVGGRAPFINLSGDHLLKTCDKREVHFYKHMPEEMRLVTPVCCASIQEHILTPLDNCCTKCTVDELGNISRFVVEPRQLDLMSNYVIIADMTHGMRLPCVLDIKLGTRTHGDAAPPEKVQRMMEMCLKTTSASLGIRLCGMKHFDENGDEIVVGKTGGKLILDNKNENHSGRAMDEAALTEAIHLFFKPCPQAVDEVMRRVKEIKSVLLGIPGLRLFGSSLLIALEANPHVGDTPSDLARVCIIDFAKATFPGHLQDKVYEGVDGGLIMGFDSVNRILSNI